MIKDRVYSSRLNENTIFQIRTLAHELKEPSNAVIEHAIGLYWNHVHHAQKEKGSLLLQAFGAWKDREEDADEIARTIRKTFGQSFKRRAR